VNLVARLVPLFAVAAAAAQDQQPKPEPPELMPRPQIVVLPRGDAAIAVDGSLADWPGLPPIALDDQRQLSGTAGNAWRGPNDLSGIAFVTWDADALYIACSVRDEWHRALDSATLLLSEVPPADCIVLSFDPERDTRGAGLDPGRTEDREFWLADEKERQVVQWDRLRGTARTLEANAGRAVVLHDKERSITTYEAKIAWSEILPVSKKVAPGLVFDLQIVLNDFDEATDPMPQTRIGWTFGCLPVVDPGLFGTAMLVDAAVAKGGPVPEFPPRTASPDPAAQARDWQELTKRLLNVPPAAHDGSKSPEEAGGLARLAVLEDLEERVARFPRVDVVELHHRIHRRMQREVAGLAARGLPNWWQQRLIAVSKNAEDQVANGSVRLFRLPMGGWLVRTPIGGFLIDAAGANLADLLWGGAQFCILTEPLDMTKRNDQLLLRMLMSVPPRAIFTHIAFHLPQVAMDKVPLFEPGQSFTPASGAEITALGKKLDDGKVTWSCSYVVTVPNGPRLLVVAPNLLVDEANVENVDVLLLTPRNPDALKIVAKVKPGLVVIDETFGPETFPNQPRARLADLFRLQKALGSQRSVLLAPGESWDVAKAAPK